MRTVAIVGSHSKALETAPFDKPVDVWVFNAVAGKKDTWVKHCSAVFQMHPPAIYRSPHNREDPNHWRWLQQLHDFPIYMLDADPLVPACVKYPLEDVCELLLSGLWYQNGADKRYFSSSVDYALALAIYKGYERIELHGVEMSSNTEYTYQRIGVAFWEGLAIGRGINFEHFGGEQIFDRPLYGYQGNLEHDIPALEFRLGELGAKRKEAQSLVFRAEMQLTDGWKDAAKLPEYIGIFREAKKRLGYFEAAHDEIERYLFKARAAKKAGQSCFIDRNEHEESAFRGQEDCDRNDRLMKETAGAVNVAMQSWFNGENPETLKWLKKFVYTHAGHAEDLGRSNGILNENLRLMKAADLAITAAGGEKAMEMVKEAAE